ncbi:MAG: GNAT family N-acetyltransferase [Pseudomonadota bacterium]
MSRPDLLAAMDATWPPAEVMDVAGWTLRRGAGGGKRVSAATCLAEGAEIDLAEARMREMGQVPLFMLRRGEVALDTALAERGYGIIDPVTLYSGPAGAIAEGAAGQVIECEAPLALMKTLWEIDGIGPARLEVMARTTGPRSYLFARIKDAPAGVAFVAASGDVTMMHAVVVAPSARRQGVGRALSVAAARWAVRMGAATLALATTEENAAANGLYRSIGMQAVGGYHYRIHRGGTA